MPYHRLIICLMAASAASAVASDLTVFEAVFTANVANRQFGKPVAPNSPARPLYFWTKLQGGKEAFRLLQREGKLPIKHYWTSQNVFESGAGRAIEPTQEADDRTLSAGKITELDGIRSLVDQGQQFTWRTWTHKRAIWSGTWVVRVLYADGDPVMCGKEACTFTIVLGD